MNNEGRVINIYTIMKPVLREINSIIKIPSIIIIEGFNTMNCNINGK